MPEAGCELLGGGGRLGGRGVPGARALLPVTPGGGGLFAEGVGEGVVLPVPGVCGFAGDDVRDVGIGEKTNGALVFAGVSAGVGVGRAVGGELPDGEACGGVGGDP